MVTYSAQVIRLLVPALLIPLLAAPSSDASPAPAPTHARANAAVVTTYDCNSDFGSGSGVVRVSTKLPQSVRVSQRLRSRVVRVSLTLPWELVDELRRNHVRSLEGSSEVTRLRVGKKRLAVRDVTIPRTKVPDEGSMTLRGVGTADAFSIRRAGEYSVRVPRRFAADITARINEYSATRTLTCTVTPGASRQLTTLLVRN